LKRPVHHRFGLPAFGALESMAFAARE